MPTHLGQIGRQHVVLELIGGAIGGCGIARWDFVRNNPDGTSGGIFRVPAGHLLVITDVDWQYVHPNGGAAAGQMQILRLFVTPLGGEEPPMPGTRVFESAIILSSTGEGGASVAMTAGFTVADTAQICPDVFPGPEGPPSGLQHLLLRGYVYDLHRDGDAIGHAQIER